MKRHIRPMFASACVLLAINAHAQSTPLPSALARYINPQAGMTVTDAIAYALEHEPLVRAARAEADAARGTLLQATLRPNPTLLFERRAQPGGTDNQTAAQIEWPLELFRRNAPVSVADGEVRTSDRAVDDRVRMLTGDVRSRYGRAASAARDVAIAEDLAVSTRRAFDLLRQRVEQGATPPFDRDLMDVELRRVEVERILALGRADAAMFELKRTMGMRPGETLFLRDTLEVLAPVPMDDSSATQVEVSSAENLTAVGQRSDVRQTEAAVALAESRLAQARSEGRVDLNLFGSFMRMDQSFPQLAFGTGGVLEPIRGVFHYAAAGAMVTLPLRNRNQGAINAAQAQRAAASARLESVRLAAETELAEADALVRQTRRALTFSEGAVRMARQNLDVMQQTYQLGRGTVSDVLTQQSRYLETERAHTQTLLMAYDAQAALLLARGE